MSQVIYAGHLPNYLVPASASLLVLIFGELLLYQCC